jgi:hypothetical protein
MKSLSLPQTKSDSTALPMTVIPTEYLPPAQNIDERAARVGSYYHSGKRAAAQLVVYNLLAGIELIGIRDELAHGHWLKWCEKNLPEGMSYRSAAYFIGLAEALIPKIATLANFDFKQLQLTNGDLDEKQLQPFSEAVQQVTNGQKFKELLREYGLIRENTPQSKRDNSRKQTAEEAEAAADALVAQHLQNIAGDIFALIRNAENAVRAQRDDVKCFYEQAICAASKWSRDILKARKVGRVAPRGPSQKKKGPK